MARRPTIRDVAEAAGLSQATVDRVLNGREQVREDTARRVYEAARRIGYHAAPLIAQRLQADLPTLRMGVVLHKERQAFYQAFATELEAAAPRRLAVVAGAFTMTVLRLIDAGRWAGSGLSRTASAGEAGVGLPRTLPSLSRTNAGCDGATMPRALAATARRWGSRSWSS